MPGNHDIAPLWRPFARLFNPYARYRRHFSEELDSLYVDDDLLVMGLNSVHPLRWKEGRVTTEQTAWIEACVRRYPNRFHVVAAHHPIADVADRPLRHRVRRARALVRHHRPGGVELLLTGHLHESYNGPAAQKIGRDRSLLARPGFDRDVDAPARPPERVQSILIDSGHVIVDLQVLGRQALQSGTLGGYRLASGRWQPELDVRGDAGVLVPHATGCRRRAELCPGEERVDLGGADEVVLTQAADGVGPVRDLATGVRDLEIGVVIFAVRHPGERVHERHRLVEVLELEGPDELRALHLPARHLFESCPITAESRAGVPGASGFDC